MNKTTDDRMSIRWTITRGKLVVTYLVTVLEPNPEVARRVWSFRKLDENNAMTGEAYTIWLNLKKKLECDCPGFEGYGRCKHVRAMGKFLGISVTQESGEGSPTPAA